MVVNQTFRTMFSMCFASALFVLGGGGLAFAEEEDGSCPGETADAEDCTEASESASDEAEVREGESPELEDGTLDILVVGDSFGDGVWLGLRAELGSRDDVELHRHSRASTGLVRLDYYDWLSKVEQICSSGSYDVAVVVVACPGALVGVLPHPDLDGQVEVELRLESIARSEEGGGRSRTVYRQLHVSRLGGQRSMTFVPSRRRSITIVSASPLAVTPSRSHSGLLCLSSWTRRAGRRRTGPATATSSMHSSSWLRPSEASRSAPSSPGV